MTSSTWDRFPIVPSWLTFSSTGSFANFASLNSLSKLHFFTLHAGRMADCCCFEPSWHHQEWEGILCSCPPLSCLVCHISTQCKANETTFPGCGSWNEPELHIQWSSGNVADCNGTAPHQFFNVASFAFSNLTPLRRKASSIILSWLSHFHPMQSKWNDLLQLPLQSTPLWDPQNEPEPHILQSSGNGSSLHRCFQWFLSWF